MQPLDQAGGSFVSWRSPVLFESGYHLAVAMAGGHGRGRCDLLVDYPAPSGVEV